MSAIQDYRQIGCGCCTGHAETVKAQWGEYEARADQCTCWMHQDATRGVPARKCSRHQTNTGTDVRFAE